ncbi:MAG: hypothetical protein KBB01_04075 [Candidatus Omnitrophica bacterium]|nr:hypothetical protein [Candidatus Omnitrophota bacterium]
MSRDGLCGTCIQLSTCIFDKDPVVWECEEFSDNNNLPKSLGRTKKQRVDLRLKQRRSK